MGYRLRFTTYSGMGYDIECGERRDMRREAAAILREAHAAGEPVAILERGSEWEFETPEDAGSIGDRDGFMRLLHDTFHCRECGSEYEGIGDALDCCSERYDDSEDDSDG